MSSVVQLVTIRAINPGGVGLKLVFYLQDHVNYAENDRLVALDQALIFQGRYLFVNPFPLVDAFSHICSSRLLKNIVAKEEIAQNEQFLPLPQCFQLHSWMFFSCFCQYILKSRLVRNDFQAIFD